MSNDVTKQKVELLRATKACKKHLRISEGLKEYGHADSNYSDSAMYWGNACDDCAEQIATREWTITL